MSPAKQELASGQPFSGPSGKILNDALTAARHSRSATYVTNLCEFFIDDNDLYSVPQEIMDRERARVFAEIDSVQPHCLLIMGGDTLHLLTGRQGITKWRGSTFLLETPSGRQQKCVAAMHPAAFIRGQWKWLPLFKYIDVQRAVTQSSFPDLRPTARASIVGPSFRQAQAYLAEALTKEYVSIDYEGYEYLTCLGFGWSASEAMCIPLSRVGTPTYWTLEEEMVIWQLWCQLLQNPKVKKVAQNAAFEWIKSWQHGIFPNPLGLDTMLMHHCLYPDWGGASDEWSKRKRDIDNPGHGLALITSQYTDCAYYKDDGRHWRPELGELRFWEYNCKDVMVTYECAMKMLDELRAEGLEGVYQQNYVEPFEKSLQMEWHGTPIDIALREQARLDSKAELSEVTVELQDILKMKVITKAERKGAKSAPDILNLASPKQMQAFFLKRGYKLGINRKTGKPTVDRDTLNALAIKHDDASIKLMLRMKKIQDFINDILDARLDENNKIHCHFKLGGTNGTRWSSTESILGSGTNLQNLPRQGVARALFIPSV